MERNARTRLVTAVLLAAVFGTGFVMGLAVDRNAEAAPAVEATADEGEREERERRTPMYEQVGPTPDQSVLIDSIVTEHRGSMKALQKEFRDAYNPRYQALIESTRAAIRAVFDEAQAAQYDSLLADYDRRRAERESRDDQDE